LRADGRRPEHALEQRIEDPEVEQRLVDVEGDDVARARRPVPLIAHGIGSSHVRRVIRS
jgi:hypothetical protein